MLTALRRRGVFSPFRIQCQYGRARWVLSPPPPPFQVPTPNVTITKFNQGMCQQELKLSNNIANCNDAPVCNGACPFRCINCLHVSTGGIFHMKMLYPSSNRRKHQATWYFHIFIDFQVFIDYSGFELVKPPPIQTKFPINLKQLQHLIE